MADNSEEKISVYVIPGAPPGDEARAQLLAAAAVLHQRAADAHAQGMFLEGQSVRIEQLAEGVDDEDAVKIRDLFVREGVLEVRKIAPVEEELAVVVTAKGGQG